MRHYLGLTMMAFGLALGGCSESNATKEAEDSREYEIIATYVAAYNDRDVDAMAALMHPEIQWLSIEGSETQIVSDGKSDLVEQMQAYVTSSGATTSSLAGAVTDGRFVAVREVARWQNTEGDPSEQSALAVYELEDGLVRRVWYYPSSR